MCVCVLCEGVYYRCSLYRMKMVGGELVVEIKKVLSPLTTVSIVCPSWLSSTCIIMWLFCDLICTVEGSTETIENPLHEAAKRGNLPFLQECITNRVSGGIRF